MAYHLCILEVFRGEIPTPPAHRAALKMDLVLIAGSFASTTFTIKPVSEAGQNFLGFATESVTIGKSDLSRAERAVAAKGLKMGRRELWSDGSFTDVL
jgi:hypothetical protein